MQSLFFIMKLLMDFTQLFVSDVGVDLRGSNARVAEHSLDAANVCAIAK